MNVDKEIALLQQLVAVRSFSREEDGTATVIYDYLSESGISPERYGIMCGQYLTDLILLCLH